MNKKIKIFYLVTHEYIIGEVSSKNSKLNSITINCPFTIDFAEMFSENDGNYNGRMFYMKQFLVFAKQNKIPIPKDKIVAEYEASEDIIKLYTALKSKLENSSSQSSVSIDGLKNTRLDDDFSIMKNPLTENPDISNNSFFENDSLDNDNEEDIK